MANYVIRQGAVLLYSAFLWAVLSPWSAQSKNDPKVQIIGSYVIVLDAGHGGEDQGTHGPHCTEKEVNLIVCQKLAEQLKVMMPNSRIILTRSADTTVSLAERTSIANRYKADLFLSIHCNSNPNHRVRGTESYVMGMHKADENLEIVRKENAYFIQNEQESTALPDENMGFILLQHYQEINLQESIRIAYEIEKQFNILHPGGSRGVRQAGFMVLHQVGMPSALIELGYMSHEEEEKYLCSSEGQEEIAQQLSSSIGLYFLNKELLAEKK